MLDPFLIRNKLQDVKHALSKRGFELDTSMLESLEEKRKSIQIETQALQAERNRRSKEIGKAKAAGEDIQQLLDEVASLGDKLKAHEAELDDIRINYDHTHLPSSKILLYSSSIILV